MILHRGKPSQTALVGQGQGLHQLPAVGGAGAEVADFALADQQVECLERFVEGGLGVEPVKLVEIDGFDAEPAETGLASLDDVFAGQADHVRRPRTHLEEHLGGDDQFVESAILPEKLARDLLAPADRVHVGGVEEVEAEFKGAAEERAGGGLVEDPGAPGWIAIAHAAEAKAGDDEPRVA